MRDNLTTYQIWAPEYTVWTQWTKPVLFTRSPSNPQVALNLPEIDWISQREEGTMVIIDLPGKAGVEEGLALARMGYRPIPLYNGVCGPSPAAMIVKVDQIVDALFQGADHLISISLPTNAPPAFLLDYNRMSGSGKAPGKFDNRWCVFPQDMPSASFLVKEGIKKIYLRTYKIQNDLAHILARYQEKGIKIYTYNGTEPMKELDTVKPSNFRSIFYRFKVIFGLVRNGAGGFGGKIPEPTQSSSGVRYRGIG